MISYICIDKVCERYLVDTLQPLLVDGCSHLPLNAGDCLFSMQKEVWIPIDDFEGKYEVSNHGFIRNLTSKKLLKTTKTRKYDYVSVWVGKKRVRKILARIVAQAFIPNPLNLPQVNHKDEDPNNNAAENLEWCTASYNCRYGSRVKRILESRVKQGAKTREKAVCGIRCGKKLYFKSIMEASRATGVDYSNISKCCRPGCYNKTAGGYVWEYAKLEQF